MKSILQNYKTGVLSVTETPTPQLRPGWVLVKNSYSLISAGTEKTKVDTGKKSLVGKAMARPDLVKKVMAKAKRDGVLKAWQAASARLEQPTPIGYSCAGQVVDLLGDVDGMSQGDWVACGGGTANHAEVVCIPRNLAAPIPEGVAVDQAAFATVGAIAMQGVRQAEVCLGERVAVIGLGLVGLITVQLLKAAGCRVLGVDVDRTKLEVASSLGCDQCVHAGEGVEEHALLFTGGYGVDATIITASTSSNGPIEQAGEITREKGRVVVVGATGLTVPREPYYMKEVDLRISRSYGPGRYDSRYEEEGVDYPYGYVRFTEKRNMACFLDLIEGGKLKIPPMITHRFSIDEAAKAYDLIAGENKQPYLGILLEYPRAFEEIPRRIEVSPHPLQRDQIRVGVIGAGNYATANLLPYIQKHGQLQFSTLCTGSGLSAPQVGQRFGFLAADANPEQVIKESDVLVVATRHNDHAAYVIQALQAGKSVFVEKPLVITREQLSEVMAAAEANPQASVAVGFNRRFAPATQMVMAHLAEAQGPRNVLIRVNAGAIPSDHWIQNLSVGGGRLIGEGCHFVDLAIALVGEPLKRIRATGIPKPGLSQALWDDFSIQMDMEDGSVATIVYTSIGDTGLPKELIEVSRGGRSAVINDFVSVDLWEGGKKVTKSWKGVSKGQAEQIQAWADALQKGRSSIPFSQIVDVHRACLDAIDAMADRENVPA